MALWFILLVGLGAVIGATDTSFTEIQEMPDGESSSASALLGASSGDSGTEQATIVWHADAAVDAPAVEAEADAVWSYADPLPESAAVKDLLRFYDERVEVEIDSTATSSVPTRQSA